MANRYGRNPVVMVAKESSFGDIIKVITNKHADTLNMKKIVNSIDIAQKTGTKEPKAKQSAAGYESVEVTLEGVLTANHEWLWESLSGDAASPYVLASNVIPSYSLFNYWNDTGTQKYDVAYGCKMTEFSITSEGEGNVTYSATFRGKGRTMEVSDAAADILTLTTVTDSSMPSDAPMLAPITTCEIEGTTAQITQMISGGLSVSNAPADDTIIYQNSRTMLEIPICSHSGTANFSWIYDTADDIHIYDNLVGTLQKDTMVLTDGSATWTIVTYGKITDYDRPIPEACKIISSLTKQLMGSNDGINKALEVTVA